MRSLIALSNSNQEFEAEFLQLELGLFIAGRNPAVIMKTKLLPFPNPPAETLSAGERPVLTARIIARLEENNQLLLELASIRADRDALERARRCMRWDEIKRENRPKLDRGNGE